MTLRIKRFTGEDLEPHLKALADLRISVFRSFPYLYQGDREYESAYLATYAEAPGAAIFGVLDGNHMVGAATCVPLTQETEDVQAPFRAAGDPVDRIFYFGESLLLPEYRGQGLGVRFFAEREGEARRQGFRRCVFCGVHRSADHPMRPKDFVPLDAFWMNRGYRKLPNRSCTMTWRDLGNPVETEKRLDFWGRDLSEPAP